MNANGNMDTNMDTKNESPNKELNKLLIVEDEDIIRKGLAGSVQWESWGFQVCGEAVNGRVALEFIERNEVDVVMTDVRMPVMDGLELTRRVKALKPEVKVVVLTGFSEFEYARQSLENGVFQYILKPVKRDKLAEVFMQLREALDQARWEKAEKATLIRQADEGRLLIAEKRLNHWVHGRLDVWDETVAIPWEAPSGCTSVCAVVDLDNPASCDPDFMNRYRQHGYATMRDAAQQVLAQSDGFEAGITGYDDFGRLVLVLALKSRNDQGRTPDGRANPNPDLGPGQNTCPDPTAPGLAADHTRLTVLLHAIVKACSDAWDGASFSAGIGNAADQAAAVPASYDQAAAALAYRFYSGPDSVRFHAEIPVLRALTPHEFQQIKQAEKRLLTYIAMGEGELELIYGEMFAEIGEHGSVEYGAVRNAVSQTMYSACGYVVEQGLDTELKMLDEIAMTGLTDLRHILSFAKRRMNEIRVEIERNDPTAGRNLVRQAKEIVAEQFGSELSLTELAGKLYVNPSYFSWLFKHETGLTFTAYVTNIRMETAKSLLKKDVQKVYEVARHVGYNDYRHFCRTFKKVVGISPKDYKQRGK